MKPRSMTNATANLCLLLISSVAGLCLCELCLQLFYPKYTPLAETLRIQDQKLTWNSIPNSRSHYPHPDADRSHLLHHNNLALRQHRNFSETDIQIATNVGVFGDSFLENVAMAAPYSFTEPLDYLLNQRGESFNVLNFGVGGYGPDRSFLRYKHFRHAKELDYVLFVYCNNDLTNLSRWQWFDLDEADRLVENPLVSSPPWRRLISRLHLPYLILDARGRLSSFMEESLMDNRQWARTLRRPFYRKKMSTEDLKNSLAILRQLLRRWKEAVERNGGVFYVVLLPIALEHPDVASVLREEGIEVFDLYDCFSDRDPAHAGRSWNHSPYRFKNDSHWNEVGNYLAAVCLYRFLEEKMKLPELSGDTLQEVLRRYYSAFGGMPMNGGEGGNDLSVSSQTLARIREKYEAFDNPAILKEEVEALAATGKRVIRSDFDVYLDGRLLVYVKEGCRPADMQPRFFLHVTLIDDDDLPWHRVEHGFDNLDFSHPPVIVDGETCVVRAGLPLYGIHSIRTGQYVPGEGPLWEGDVIISPRQDQP